MCAMEMESPNSKVRAGGTGELVVPQASRIEVERPKHVVGTTTVRTVKETAAAASLGTADVRRSHMGAPEQRARTATPKAKAKQKQESIDDSRQRERNKKSEFYNKLVFGLRVRIKKNNRIGHHDVTNKRDGLALSEATITIAPVYPNTWVALKMVTGENAGETVKVRTSQIELISESASGNCITLEAPTFGPTAAMRKAVNSVPMAGKAPREKRVSKPPAKVIRDVQPKGHSSRGKKAPRSEHEASAQVRGVVTQKGHSGHAVGRKGKGGVLKASKSPSTDPSGSKRKRRKSSSSEQGGTSKANPNQPARRRKSQKHSQSAAQKHEASRGGGAHTPLNMPGHSGAVPPTNADEVNTAGVDPVLVQLSYCASMILNVWQQLFSESIEELTAAEIAEMALIMRTCTLVDGRGLRVIYHQLIYQRYGSVIACIGDIRRLFRNSYRRRPPLEQHELYQVESAEVLFDHLLVQMPAQSQAETQPPSDDSNQVLDFNVFDTTGNVSHTSPGSEESQIFAALGLTTMG